MSRWYSIGTSGAKQKFPLQVLQVENSQVVYPPILQGGIAMKKISIKQLLVKAMEQYGNNLILSERIWFPPYPRKRTIKRTFSRVYA